MLLAVDSYCFNKLVLVAYMKSFPMRITGFIVVSVITIGLVVLLNNPIGSIPALGKLLDPVNGWGANAEPEDKDFSLKLSALGLQQPVTVWLEGRLVPHIQAANDHDLYFMQGFIHAYFRLWQMDMQTRAAAGRVGEVVGEKWVTDSKTGERKNVILDFDRTQRRKGMVFGAENSLRVMEADPRTKAMLDAYTEGINHYISGLKFKNYPLEYKLMGFSPEPWTNLKCALLLKYMADDLTGYTEDIPLSMLRDKLPADMFHYLFPQRISGSKPVIPAGTRFDEPSMEVPQTPQGDIWAHFNDEATAAGTKETEERYDDGTGSNNWAVSGAYTASGSPILCNDPHLGLNLPSLWFEMQLQAPGINVYGVSLPGAPGIIIGFNDSLSWGLTNNYRDVKDFYEIEPIDRNFYRFDGKPQPYDKRNEVIGIKGKDAVVDTVDYTLHGPVLYDKTFPDPSGSGKKLAMCWMAHRGTNELLAIYLLNRANTYLAFTEAIMYFQCPAQNFVYADRAGNIAIWGQGQFINKWKDQGRYVMKGNTSATLWGKDIPMMENPHALNPQQGYLASANQVTTDSTYPYWYNGYFYDFRAWRINNLLGRMVHHTIPDEMNIQQDVYSILASQTSGKLDSLLGLQDRWDYSLGAESVEATRFQVAWSMVYEHLWQKEFPRSQLYPSPERTMQLVQQDTGRYAALIEKTCKEIRPVLEDSLASLGNNTGWYRVKGTQLTHLAKLDAFSYKDLKIGGWGNTINAAKKTHGPSWRMIVALDKDSIRAYGVYPGGQSGNPGSQYYGSFVQQWAKGEYNRLTFFTTFVKDKPASIRYIWNIQPSKK